MADIKKEIGNYLHELIANDKKGRSLKQLATDLNKYRAEHFEGIKQVKEVNEDLIDHWMRGDQLLRLVDIISLSEVLDVSCDQILKGAAPSDQTLIGEFGLSPKAVVSFRNHHKSAEVVNYFIENDEYLMVLERMRDFIETPDQHLEYTDETTGEPTYVSLADIRMANIENILRKVRVGFKAKKRVMASLRSKRGGNPDGKTGQRGRDDKETET